MEAMTGLTAAEVVGSTGLAQLQPRDAEGNRVWLEHWVGVGIPAEVLITTPDGERWLGCSSAVGGGGETLVVVARDVTRAREIDRMKDDFIATVSHELRTPLATIRGFTELLEPPSTIPEATRTEAIARIRKSTYRLERLVANLLEVTRIEARRSADVLPAELDVCDIVTRVVDEVGESWPDRTIDVDTGGGAWRAQGSLLSLERILINLLSNALTYAPHGSILLKVRAEGDDGIAVSVRDHGPGIPAHQQGRIFERFERLHTARQKAGTGLGLYIAQGLARGMGAEVTVASQVGLGAEFTVHLRTPDDAHRPSVAELVC
jgi:two-component system phosphate regulon sensor histidine kinase PhoR